MKVSIATLAAALLMAGGIGRAAAQSAEAPRDIYLSGSTGLSHSTESCAGVASCDKDAWTGRVLVGYRLFPFLAVEAHYSPRIGEASATDSGVTASFKADSVGLGLAGLYTFGSFTAILRGGAASHKTKASGSGLGVSVSESQRKTQPYIGAGLSYAISPQFEIGLAYDHDRIKFEDTHSSFNAYSIVGTMRF